MTIPTTARPGSWISILLVVLGAIALVFAIGGGVVRGVAAHSATSQSWTASADGVAALRIDSTAAGFEVRFDDVDEARLDASTDGGPVQQWQLVRVDSGSGACALPSTYRWTSTGPLAQPQNGQVALAAVLVAQ